MMESRMLGRLEQVPSREVFEHEVVGFTPWLAQEDNLQLLGAAVGIPLHLIMREQPVGSLRADLLCRNDADQWVLIENQLGRTDHCHLGQILTYAAGLKAFTVIWVAGQFTDEHRAALDWLNEMTVQGVQIIGFEIEFWRIGQSDVAPKFNVVFTPNKWAREVSSEASIVDIRERTARERVHLCLQVWAGERQPTIQYVMDTCQVAKRTAVRYRDEWYQLKSQIDDEE